MPTTGRLVANPGCYATATLLALAPLKDAIEPGVGRRRRALGHDRGGPHAEGVHALRRGARERDAVPRRRPPARARDRAAARLPGLLHAPPPARSGAVSSPPATSARPAPTFARCWKRPTPAARSSPSCPRGWRPSLPASSIPTGPRSASSATASPTARCHLRRRQPRQGRSGPGDPEREPCARPRADGRAAARRGHGLVMSRHCCAGLRGERRLCRDQAVGAPRCRRRSLRPARRRRRAVDDEPRPGGSRHRFEAPSRAGRATGRVDQRRRRERGNRERRARRTPSPRLSVSRMRSGSRPSRSLVLSTGVIGARLPLDKVLAGARAAAAELSADGGDAAAGAILTTDSGPKVAVAAERRFHRRRHGEGGGDDPPPPRDDARGDHDRLPARCG